MTSTTEQNEKLNALIQEIIEMIKAESPGVNLTVDSGLQDGGLDSLKVMSLVLRIESRYGIELDADDADELNTLADLGRLVLRRIEEK
ncbi:MAG: phosphopantetheine-binding protein [Mycobacterium sp.]|jgi:acyl carrier protein|nr:phosphopantetheine-binding protein [Mycobacterium sp.]MDT5215345.1 acyl carrier protein [Mycobacterium sp.]MDT7756086.1 acyl carrier protein [Mycobacterium sp.]